MLTQEEYQCLDECPQTAPFYVAAEPLEGKDSTFMCTDACPKQRPYVDQSSLKCIKNCRFYEVKPYPVGDRTINIQKCVGKCEFGVQEGNNVECMLQCPLELPYFN